MAKALAKRNLISFAILAVILAVLCFVNFAIPTLNYRFVGFANAIVKDLDISGSVASSYEIKFSGETNEDELTNAVKMLNSKFNEFGYGSARVSVSGTDEVYIELPNIKKSSAILDAVATEGGLYIRGTETTEVGETDITGKEISNVSSSFSQINYGKYSWGVNIDFTKHGKSKLADMTSSGSGTIYVYVGETKVSAISYSNAIDQSYMFFYGDYDSADTTNITVLKLLMGKYDADFDMINNQIVETAPVISNNIGTWLIILLCVVAVLFIVAMFSLFGEFGWIINLSFAFFAVFLMFFMQAIPIFVLSLSGVVGTIFGVVLLYISYLIIFNNIKKGYADGKKIPLATKWGFNKGTLRIVDINVITIIACVAMYFLGGVFAQSFAFALALCSALNLLISLLLTRWFSKWYLAINSKNADKLHLVREAHIDELN